MHIQGQPVDFKSPRDALRVGISYIPQELAYLTNGIAADNILIGRGPHRAGMTSDATIASTAAAEAKKFGIDLHVSWRMADLTLAERQLVEIVKALTRSSQVLVLDEPTASLTSGESRKLFSILRQLVETGLSVIFISHRMDEVFEVSDGVVVLRNGEVVGDVPTSEATRTQLISFMLGAAADELAERRKDRVFTEPALQLLDWSWTGEPRIHDLNLTVHRGEIVTLFGLRGSGGEAIAEGLAGRNSKFCCRVRVRGGVTRGVDVGARFGIHHYLRTLAEQGTAILWVTTDVEEAVVVADRLVVLREGKIVAELTGNAKTQGQAVAMAAKDAA